MKKKKFDSFYLEYIGWIKTKKPSHTTVPLSPPSSTFIPYSTISFFYLFTGTRRYLFSFMNLRVKCPYILLYTRGHFYIGRRIFLTLTWKCQYICTVGRSCLMISYKSWIGCLVQSLPWEYLLLASILDTTIFHN